jgi:protein ImuA
MSATKADIISRLQKEILSLQGFRTALTNTAIDVIPGPIKKAFPNEVFPLGTVHEFICTSQEDASASAGFISGVLTSLMGNDGVCLWISSSQSIYPPALKLFGIEPDKIIFVELKKEKEIIWAMEEALKCDGLAAVVGEMQELDFTVSRRLQLAVEQSRVTGFILRRSPRKLSTTACIARWKITSIPGIVPDDMPGVGFPSWNIELLRMRNGKTGSWKMMWMNGSFQAVFGPVSIIYSEQKKTG